MTDIGYKNDMHLLGRRLLQPVSDLIVDNALGHSWAEAAIDQRKILIKSIWLLGIIGQRRLLRAMPRT